MMIIYIYMEYCYLSKIQQNIFDCYCKKKTLMPCVKEKVFRAEYLGLICARPITACYWSIYCRLCQRFRKKEILDGNDRV